MVAVGGEGGCEEAGCKGRGAAEVGNKVFGLVVCTKTVGEGVRWWVDVGGGFGMWMNGGLVW